MFAQVFVVIAINAVAAGIYDIIQFVQLSKAVTVGATFLWLGLNGVPGVAYFAMNPTIRNECLVMFGLRKHNNQVHSGGGSLTASASARGANKF
ncbi:hypothetical protein AAVH_17790 [Aphelenchoides avenae]|nr:hypothetical protein AAVH_17790 [Aphelenchus avenae]